MALISALAALNRKTGVDLQQRYRTGVKKQSRVRCGIRSRRLTVTVPAPLVEGSERKRRVEGKRGRSVASICVALQCKLQIVNVD